MGSSKEAIFRRSFSLVPEELFPVHWFADSVRRNSPGVPAGPTRDAQPAKPENHYAALGTMVAGVVLSDEDLAYAKNLCTRLAGHEDRLP